MHPHYEGVAERIHETIPHARIIYLVRDPVPRTIGQYVEWQFVGVERRPFEEAFADLDQTSNAYVMSSRYAHQLGRYRAHFPDSRILVLDQRDLLERRRETLRRVFRFLEVDEEFWSPEFQRHHNVAQQKLQLNPMGSWLAEHDYYLPYLRTAGWLPGPAERAALRVIGKEMPRPVPDGPMLERLQETLREDAEWLRSYTGEAYAHWSV
jgi:hypothetical protein